jgi:hypothetical protein
VHAASVSHWATEHPVGQRRVAQGFAGVDIFLDHIGHGEPAGLLPKLERALFHAKAPAHAEIDIARVVGYIGQVHGSVVEGVAQYGPQKLALRTLRLLRSSCSRSAAGFFNMRA